MAKPKVSKAHVKYSWGILIGMLTIPVLALMVKIFPQLTTAWEVGMAVAALVIVRSIVGYVMASGGAKKAAATHAH